MSEGLVSAVDRLTKEVSTINRTLLAIWSLIDNEETAHVPTAITDEYVSIDECARRLDVTEQTIRNWITQGKTGGAGWIEGVHYIILPSGRSKSTRKNLIRIPWNTVIQDMVIRKQDRKLSLKDIQYVLAPRDHRNTKDNFI
jgi:predicted transcriptional regulator